MNFNRAQQSFAQPALFSSIAGSNRDTRRETDFTQDDFPALLGGPRFEPRQQEPSQPLYASSLRSDTQHHQHQAQSTLVEDKTSIQAQLLGNLAGIVGKRQDQPTMQLNDQLLGLQTGGNRFNQQQPPQQLAPSTGLGSLPMPLPSSSPSSINEQRPADDYTLLGLLDIIKMTNQDQTMLTLGIDLTTLGLSLSTFEPLHASFISPYASDPSSGATPAFTIPSVYKPTHPIPPMLSKIKLFSEDALFYTFYTMPRDEAQEASAQELYIRGWRFHKEVRLWVSKDGEGVKGNGFERGVYVFFDPVGWNRVKKEFVLHYDMLEERREGGYQAAAKHDSAEASNSNLSTLLSQLKE